MTNPMNVARRVDNTKGTLHLLEQQTYRYDGDDGTVRKFYQLYLLRLDMEGQGTEFLLVCNFGSGVEGTHVNPKGSYTYLKHGGEAVVRNEMARKAESKKRGGYYLLTARGAGTANLPGRMLDTLGLYDDRRPRPINVNVTLGESQPAFVRPAQQPNRGGDAVATLTDVVTQMSNRLTELVATGDLVAALTERSHLAELVSKSEHMVTDAKGRLEMLNALLAAEVSS